MWGNSGEIVGIRGGMVEGRGKVVGGRGEDVGGQGCQEGEVGKARERKKKKLNNGMKLRNKKRPKH